MMTSRCGSGVRSGFVPAQGGVVGDVGDVAGVLEHLLAAQHLAVEAGVRPLDQADVVREVGDDAGDVRQARERRERGAALEVDQDHGQVLRRVGGGRPSTSVRSISDLPEPVAPTQSPCGPMPSCADSFRSSSTGWPASSTPSGTRRKSRSARGRHQARQSSGGRVADPQQGGKSDASRACARGPDRVSADSRSGASEPGEAVRGGAVDVVHRPAPRRSPSRRSSTRTWSPSTVIRTSTSRRLVQPVGDQMDVRDTEPGRIRGIRYDGVRAVGVVQHD